MLQLLALNVGRDAFNQNFFETFLVGPNRYNAFCVTRVMKRVSCNAFYVTRVM